MKDIELRVSIKYLYLFIVIYGSLVTLLEFIISFRWVLLCGLKKIFTQHLFRWHFWFRIFILESVIKQLSLKIFYFGLNVE